MKCELQLIFTSYFLQVLTFLFIKRDNVNYEQIDLSSQATIPSRKAIINILN